MESKVEALSEQVVTLNSNFAKVLERLDRLVIQTDVLPKIESDLALLTENTKAQQEAIMVAQKDIVDLQVDMKVQKSTIGTLQQDVLASKADIAKCMQRMDRMQEAIDAQESYSRRENLVFLNVNEDRNENIVRKINRIVTKMIGVEVKFTRVHRLGQPREGVDRPTIARFHYGPDRDKVWQAKETLKGTKVIVREDYPARIESNRRTLMPICSHARLQGKEAKLVKDSMYIDNRKYTVKTLETLPQELHPSSLCERKLEVEGQTYRLFAGTESVFSNWHKADMTIGGRKYTCVEQYYVHQKAVLSNDKEIDVEEVMRMTEPLKMKNYSRRVRINEELWKRKSINVMKEGVRQKILQNNYIEKKLKETQGEVLVESTRDRFWGCGQPIYSKLANDKEKWNGKNELGSIWMEYRAEVLEAAKCVEADKIVE